MLQRPVHGMWGESGKSRLRRGRGLLVANGVVEGGREASLGAQHTAEALLIQKGSEHMEERDRRSWGLHPGHAPAPPGPHRATGKMFPHHLRGTRLKDGSWRPKDKGSLTGEKAASLGSQVQEQSGLC